MKTLGMDGNEIVFGFSDLMYIPKTLSKRLMHPLTVYSTNKVFVELAWPCLVNGYIKSNERQFLSTVIMSYGNTDMIIGKAYIPKHSTVSIRLNGPFNRIGLTHSNL